MFEQNLPEYLEIFGQKVLFRGNDPSSIASVVADADISRAIQEVKEGLDKRDTAVFIGQRGLLRIEVAQLGKNCSDNLFLGYQFGSDAELTAILHSTLCSISFDKVRDPRLVLYSTRSDDGYLKRFRDLSIVSKDKYGFKAIDGMCPLKTYFVLEQMMPKCVYLVSPAHRDDQSYVASYEPLSFSSIRHLDKRFELFDMPVLETYDFLSSTREDALVLNMPSMGCFRSNCTNKLMEKYNRIMPESQKKGKVITLKK